MKEELKKSEIDSVCAKGDLEKQCAETISVMKDMFQGTLDNLPNEMKNNFIKQFQDLANSFQIIKDEKKTVIH